MALLLVAVGLLVAALGTGRIALAWGSVALSAVVAAMIVARWRRRRDTPDVEPVVLLDDEPVDVAYVDPLIGPAAVDAAHGDQPVHPARDAALVEQPPQPASMIAGEDAGPVVASATSTDHVAEEAELAEAEAAEPGEEDTDAADLLVVYELNDQVLVVDEHPRYHLTRCPWPDQARAERLPVREARELGFTPCDRCRPDTALAHRHRAASATTGGS